MTQTLRVLFLTIFLSVSLSGCVYKIDVQQGNILTNKDIAKIHRGMSTTAVKKILGDPLLQNVYKDNQMTYVYTMKRGHRKMTRRNVTVHFSGSRVTSVSTSFTH